MADAHGCSVCQKSGPVFFALGKRRRMACVVKSGDPFFTKLDHGHRINEFSDDLV